MSLEGIEDDNGLCYCIPVPGPLLNPDVPQLCCWSLLDCGICVDRLGPDVRLHFCGSCHLCLTGARFFVIRVSLPRARPYLSQLRDPLFS